MATSLAAEGIVKLETLHRKTTEETPYRRFHPHHTKTVTERA